MDILNIILGIICVIGSIFWFMWFLNPEAVSSDGQKGPGKLMNRVAYLLASLAVLETALSSFGAIERASILTALGVQ